MSITPGRERVKPIKILVYLDRDRDNDKERERVQDLPGDLE